VLPGYAPFVDVVAVVGVAVLAHLIVFSQASPLLDRLGNAVVVLLFITRSPAVTGLCSSGNAWDDRVAHVIGTWVALGGTELTVFVGLFAGVATTVLLSPCGSGPEASTRLGRVGMRIAHATRMTVRAFGRVKVSGHRPAAPAPVDGEDQPAGPQAVSDNGSSGAAPSRPGSGRESPVRERQGSDPPRGLQRARGSDNGSLPAGGTPASPIDVQVGRISAASLAARDSAPPVPRGPPKIHVASLHSRQRGMQLPVSRRSSEASMATPPPTPQGSPAVRVPAAAQAGVPPSPLVGWSTHERTSPGGTAAGWAASQQGASPEARATAAVFASGPASLRAPNLTAATLAALDSAEDETGLLFAAIQASATEERLTSCPLDAAWLLCCCRRRNRPAAAFRALQGAKILQKLGRIARLMAGAERAVPASPMQAMLVAHVREPMESLAAAITDAIRAIVDDAAPSSAWTSGLCLTARRPRADVIDEGLALSATAVRSRINDLVAAFTKARGAVLYGLDGGRRRAGVPEWPMAELVPINAVLFGLLRVGENCVAACGGDEEVGAASSSSRPSDGAVTPARDAAPPRLGECCGGCWAGASRCPSLTALAFTCGHVPRGCIPCRCHGAQDAAPASDPRAVAGRGGGTCCFGCCRRTPSWPRARRSVKVSAAITIATVLAFLPATGSAGSGSLDRLEWSVWTPLTVAFVFMSASGQSVRQVVLRLGGTVAGSIFALLLVIASRGDRTAVVLGLGAWSALVANARASPRTAYAGAVAAFTAAIVAMAGFGAGGEGITSVAVSRMLQNCVGAGIYLVVSNVVWPHHGSVASLRAVADALTAVGEASRVVLRRFAGALAPGSGRRAEATEGTRPQGDGSDAKTVPHRPFTQQPVQDGTSAAVARLTSRVEPVAMGLASRLSDARSEIGLAAPRTRGVRALAGADRQLWKLVRSVRCIDQCRLALAVSRSRDSDCLGTSALAELELLRGPLEAVAGRVRATAAAAATALRALADTDARRRDTFCGACHPSADAAAALDALDARIPEALSAVVLLDSASQQLARRLFRHVLASPEAMTPAIGTSEIVLFNSAVFAARQACEAALALAATVELVAAHLLPADGIVQWVNLERERKLV